MSNRAILWLFLLIEVPVMFAFGLLFALVGWNPYIGMMVGAGVLILVGVPIISRRTERRRA